MTEIFDLAQIQEAVKEIDLVKAMEEGFIAYSQGKVVVPPVGELVFDDPPGDAHIKYGYIVGDEYFVIKIATGSYENYKLNLPTTSGLMLLFKQKTGQLASILLDGGELTNLRTAAAGAVCAKYLAPKTVHRIGVFGAGAQGKLQVEHMRPYVDCLDVVVWGIDDRELGMYKEEMETKGYQVKTTREPNDIASTCNLIITATPTKTPLLQADQIQKGVHITAMGSDTPEKQELDPGILEKADLVVADSISQCLTRGEICQALKAGRINKDDVVELGNVLVDPKLGRESDDQITVADLTGVAVQDIQISKAVYQSLVS